MILPAVLFVWRGDVSVVMKRELQLEKKQPCWEFLRDGERQKEEEEFWKWKKYSKYFGPFKLTFAFLSLFTSLFVHVKLF